MCLQPIRAARTELAISDAYCASMIAITRNQLSVRQHLMTDVIYMKQTCFFLYLCINCGCNAETMRCTLPNGVTRAQAAVFSVAAFQVPIHLLAITSSDTLMIPLYSPHTFLQQVVFGVATLLCVRTIFNNILESVGSYIKKAKPFHQFTCFTFDMLKLLATGSQGGDNCL